MFHELLKHLAQMHLGNAVLQSNVKTEMTESEAAAATFVLHTTLSLRWLLEKAK